MKKVISILMLTVLLITFCSCGKGKEVIAVEEAISSIGAVTIDSEEKIISAEELYGALTEKEKGKVENYAVLTDARAKYEEIKAEYEGKYDDAIRYLKQDKIDEAIAVFKELGAFKDSKDYLTYSIALSYCQVGDYESGYEELQKIPDFIETKSLLRQIYYETMLFEGLKELRTSMKNPDSLGVNEVTFTYDDSGNSEALPACIVTVSGQNGLGGYSTSLALFTYDEEDKVYSYLGSCSSLEIESSDDLYDRLIKVLIKGYLEDEKVENPIDIERVNAVVASKKYTNIKRISELKFEMFSDESVDDNSSTGV